ncbi:hypothetical protein SNE40_018370 [Patella caerulea]|uniref:Reverse transcriptase domain-containing protein n=1 Tax=Patella caerulea TaxID=87958 RepID=A0AAN8J847_PATCE
MALRRLLSTEKRLLRDPNVANLYSDVIRHYLDSGYIRQVSREEDNTDAWFLPHFAVVRPIKATTKVRIVFNAAAKQDGISLNDTIYQGPKLQNELFDVLLRFRRHPVALVCDIAEMYLRIETAPGDRTYHRFLWRFMDQNKEPSQYEFNRIVFGVNSSPFLAQYVTHKNAEKLADAYPMAAETILKSTYMDDSMDSVPDSNNGIRLYSELSKVWEAAGMHARKWLSNSKEVLQEIPMEDRSESVDLDEGYLPSIKTLGILWIRDEDTFSFKSCPPPDDFEITKRNFLSKIATLFDPTGFLAPFVIRAKIMLQETWTAGLDWDDQLPEHLSIKAKKWFLELKDIYGGLSLSFRI